MGRNCLLSKFLFCCALREGIALVAYFQIIFMVVETIIAGIWTSRLINPHMTHFDNRFPIGFLVFPWFSFFNQLLVAIFAIILLAKAFPIGLTKCYFWLFVVHTSAEVFMTLVEFVIGFSDVGEFVSLMIIYLTLDMYFCWTIISFAEQEKPEALPHKELQQENPRQKAYVADIIDPVPVGAYHQVNKSSVSAIGREVTFEEGKERGSPGLNESDGGYKRVGLESDYTMDRSKSPDVLFYESSDDYRAHTKTPDDQ